jgi:ribose 5-phosphate isomerase RpiB
MIIVVINETSAADKNKDIIAALEGRGHQIINAGMVKCGDQPELSYIHTSLMAAILLHTGKADLIVGGCGTGQGFMNAVMQYPNIICGHILTPLDAWLFPQINGGNCISLALNQGYGWAGEINLKFIFDRYFSVEMGCGYPEHRKAPQKISRALLNNISAVTHTSMKNILALLPPDLMKHVMQYPGFKELIDIDTLENEEIKQALIKYVE